MTAITTLGVDNLSLRGAANEYNLITRLFTTKAEADAALAAGSGSGGWVPTAGKTNICFTADQGILKYDFSSTALVNADSATRSYVDTAIADLVDSAPGALDTLNELAAAINDDANAFATLNNKIDANEVHVDNSATLSGVAKDSTHLATFTGSTITDNQTIKAALQLLETKVEAVQTDVDGNESDADTAIAANETHIDNAVTLTGVAKDSTHLATFTGATIADSSTIKAALQALETKVEAVQTDVDGNESDADSAIAAVQSDVNQNESDADAAIAAVQADVDQNESDADAAIAANEVHIDNAATLSGVAKDSTHLGTFSGSTITDSRTAKQALQELETALEEVDANANDVTTAVGIAEQATHMGTFSGSTISANGTAKEAIQELETAVETKLNSSGAKAALDVDHLITLSGVSAAADNLGTFTGGTITDNQTLKAALQLLETKVEAVQTDVDGNESDADTAIAANETHIDNAVTLTGVAKDATHLGTFTGSTIADSQTIKASLQALETKVEAVQTDVDGNEADADTAIAANETHIDNAVTLTGVAKDATHLGTFTGSTVADNQTIKAAVQALETKVEAVQTDVDGNESDADTAVAANETHIDNMATLTGVAKDATHWGAFSGSTISDNGTMKAGVQEIETALELKAPAAGPTFTGTPAAPTAAAGTNTTQLATTAFVTAAIADTIDGAPGALDTLNELAAALNDDANAASNLTTLINARSTAANGTHTGTTNIAAVVMSSGLTNAANDSAAASGGVAVNQLYRNGSVVMIRVS